MPGRKSETDDGYFHALIIFASVRPTETANNGVNIPIDGNEAVTLISSWM